MLIKMNRIITEEIINEKLHLLPSVESTEKLENFSAKLVDGNYLTFSKLYKVVR